MAWCGGGGFRKILLWVIQSLLGFEKRNNFAGSDEEYHPIIKRRETQNSIITVNRFLPIVFKMLSAFLLQFYWKTSCTLYINKIKSHY